MIIQLLCNTLTFYGSTDLKLFCKVEFKKSVAFYTYSIVCQHLCLCYLDFSGGCEQNVVWVFKTLLFALLGLRTNQQVEMCGEVAA